MATHRSIRLTPKEALHERLMRAVALRLQATPYVLKGGTALALFYGLNRHSEDLDFDDCGDRSSIKNQVRDGLRDGGASMSDFIPDYDTWKGRRFKAHYINPETGEDRLLKIELSSRSEPNPDDVVIVDGIRTYHLPALFDQKMDAADDRIRARDLFDIGFLVEKHGDRLSSTQIEHADSFSRDYEDLADRYRQAFDDDNLLRSGTTADDRALALRIAVIEQLHRRGRAVIEQAVPGAQPLADVLARHKIWLESDGREGYRANFADGDFSGAVLCNLTFEKANLRGADFRGADLRNANLRNTDLRGARFDGTDLRGADARGANITNSSFRRGILGPTSKGFAEPLVKKATPLRTRYVSSYEIRRRTEPERDFGPSR